MKRKYLIFILFIILLCFIFSLFFKNKEDSSKQVVTFWTLQLGTFDKYINNVISEFEKENPNCKIKWIDIPYSEGEKRTLASILTENPPDLINLTPDFSLLLAQKNALYTIDEKYLIDYIPAIKDSLKYNGKFFGIPFYATSAVTLYNSNLYSGNLPISYDDLFKIIPKKNTYVTMFSLTENDTLLKILYKYNINSYNNINSEKSIEIFSKIKYLYLNNYIPQESITQTHRDALEKYMSGQLAFLVTGSNFLNMIMENAPSVYKSTKILPQLTGDNGNYDYSLMNFVIPVKAKNKQAALEFALFLTNSVNQLELSKLTSILPVNKFALNDEFFTKQNEDIQVQARIISASQLNNLQSPLLTVKSKKDLNILSSNCIQEILINNKNIAQTLNKFAQDWEKL